MLLINMALFLVCNLRYAMTVWLALVCRSLLKVFDNKHFILIMNAVPVLINMIAETAGDIGAVRGNRLLIKDHQHSLQVCQPVDDDLLPDLHSLLLL